MARPRPRDRDGHRLPEFARERRPSLARSAAELPVLVAIAIVVVLIVKANVGQAFYIPSSSMEPQLLVGDRVVVSEISYHLHEPRRGDIIVFDDPDDIVEPPGGSLPRRVVREVLEGVGLRQPAQSELIKRVIGLPGENVEARGGRVLVNGRELVEPYLSADTVTADFGPVLVPDAHVFVLGDNRSNSEDSRFIGPVPIDSIVGRAVLRIWPPGRWAFL